MILQLLSFSGSSHAKILLESRLLKVSNFTTTDFGFDDKNRVTFVPLIYNPPT
jgi:hypothetical protein